MLLKRLQLWDPRLVVEVHKGRKSGDKSMQPIQSKTPHSNDTPAMGQRKDRKRKMEASEDKAIKEIIRKAETVSRNERQKKELAVFNTGRIPLF